MYWHFIVPVVCSLVTTQSIPIVDKFHVSPNKQKTPEIVNYHSTTTHWHFTTREPYLLKPRVEQEMNK